MKFKYLFIFLLGISIHFTSLTSCRSNQTDSKEFVEKENKELNGKWKLQIKTPRGPRTPTLFVNGNVGTYEDQPINLGIDGDKFSFKAEQEAGKMGVMKFRFDGMLKGDKLEGEYTLLNTTFAGRSSIFSGSRILE